MNMKKIYLGVLSVIASATCIGQNNLINLTESINKGFVIDDKDYSSSITPEKSGGVVVWTDDFSDPNTWTIDNDTMTGAGGTFGWTIDAISDGWWSTSGISSTSGGNFAELSNGDAQAQTQAMNVTYTLTTANPIDIQALAGTDQVSLSFEQYGARFNDLQEIQVSVNGVTYTTVGDNLDKPVLSASGGSPYDNPDVKTINLAPYITGMASTVWIRFSWTTNYPSSATNPNVWITYGWYIDDVEIVTNPNNDLTIIDHYFGSLGLPYYQIPLEQITPIDFSANVMNNGGVDQPNTILSVDFGGGLSLSSNPTTLIIGSTDSLFTTSQHTPNSTVGTINATWTVSSDSVDDNINDNTVSQDIEITDYVYARDMGNIDGGSYNAGEPFEVGNYFDIMANQTLKAIDVTISSSTEAGAVIYAAIYSIDPSSGDFIWEGNTDDYITTSSDVSNQATVTLPLFSPLNLNGGEGYVAIAGAYGDGGTTNDVVVATSGDSEPQTSFYYDGVDLTWYYTTSTPMVRLNFDPFISIQERDVTLAHLSQNRPNPFNENTKIIIELDEQKEVSFEVFDITGKIVKHLDLGSLGIGTHELNINSDGLKNGIYYYSLFNKDFKITKKMVLQK